MAQPPERFTVHFERSGGLAGASVRTLVNSDSLGEPDAAELRALLAGVDFAAPPGQPIGTDRFQYDITVDSGGGESRSVTAYDGSMAPGVKALTDWLMSHARGQRTGP